MPACWAGMCLVGLSARPLGSDAVTAQSPCNLSTPLLPPPSSIARLSLFVLPACHNVSVLHRPSHSTNAAVLTAHRASQAISPSAKAAPCGCWHPHLIRAHPACPTQAPPAHTCTLASSRLCAHRPSKYTGHRRMASAVCPHCSMSTARAITIHHEDHHPSLERWHAGPQPARQLVL